MSVWAKEKQPQVGQVLVIWRNRSVSRMFMKILTWFLLAFVLSLLVASVAAPFDPQDKAHKFVQLFFLLFFSYGIISSVISNLYFGQQYAIAEQAILSYQPLWKGGCLMAGLRTRFSDTHKYVEYILWDDVVKVARDDKNIKVDLTSGGNLTIAVCPVVEMLRVGEDEKLVKKQINGVWARLTQTDNKLNNDTFRIILSQSKKTVRATPSAKSSKRKKV